MAESLGGGQGDGTTDPNACSDLKGHEVGVRSAEPRDILTPTCGERPEIPKTGDLLCFFLAMVGSISKNGGIEHMCWFSAEHADRIVEAKAGERLAIKKMPWNSNWVVRETEFEMRRACPVCLTDETRVLFRFAESQQQLHFGSEAEAVFRMLKHPRRDVFEFADRSQIALGDLPAGLILDVLVVPGSEQLSAVLNPKTEQRDREHDEKESLLARLTAHF